MESTINSLSRNIQETLTGIEKSERDQLELTKKINKLRGQLELVKIRRDALLAQIKAKKKELDELRQKSVFYI